MKVRNTKCTVVGVKISESKKDGMPFLIVELETEDGKEATYFGGLSEKSFKYTLKDLQSIGVTCLSLADLEGVGVEFPSEIYATITEDKRMPGKYNAGWLTLEQVERDVGSGSSKKVDLSKFSHLAKFFGVEKKPKYEDVPAKLPEMTEDDLPF